ncbi:hypothetical protein SAMN02743940_2264 [Nitrosomonas cryotolerans ATCC 49181]|uniref:Uncharacterized protein n=1 Tax=Nitrosomonas cryotolerans ATCC 49181 TaxID=1131553 RepID=A0A1N6J2H2_9PROT|nr:hypothetical protein SAMN02743940_2264 [Nitrosomonas cryotolerans ATCC 49181]
MIIGCRHLTIIGIITCLRGLIGRYARTTLIAFSDCLLIISFCSSCISRVCPSTACGTEGKNDACH